MLTLLIREPACVAQLFTNMLLITCFKTHHTSSNCYSIANSKFTNLSTAIYTYRSYDIKFTTKYYEKYKNLVMKLLTNKYSYYSGYLLLCIEFYSTEYSTPVLLNTRCPGGGLVISACS